MTDIWCREMDCKRMSDYRGSDDKGKFGYCNCIEITVAERKCQDYEKEEELVSV